MKEKIAFFDIDKTIVKGDSMFDLILYTWKNYPKSIIPLFLSLILGTIKYVCTLAKDLRVFKEGAFYLFKYIDDNDIEKFVRETLYDKKTFGDAKEEIKKRKEEGYKLILVTASPEIYMRKFGKLLDVDVIMGTLMDEKGKIVGKNCKNIEKVRRIEQYLEEKNWEVDYDLSVAYSDSYSADRPMLELVKNRYLINSKLKMEPYINLNWK